MNFEQLIEEHYRKNRKVLVNVAAKRLSNNPSVGEEAVQEAYLRAWIYRNRFDEEKAQFASWFYTIFKNTVKDIMQIERGHPVDSGKDDVAVETNIDKTHISQAIDSYTGTDFAKRILRMVYLEQVSMKEVPYFIETTYGTVRVTCTNFRSYLEELV